MSVLELYIEKDVVGGSAFHYANFVRSCGNNLSNNESEPPTNVSNLHEDEDEEDDDYLVSNNSYVEESLHEDDSVDGGIQNPFWNDVFHYNNINWSHPNEEDICGLEMSSTFNVGQELYVDVVYTNEHILKAYSAQWWPLGNEAAIPPSDEPLTLIPDPTTIRVKGVIVGHEKIRMSLQHHLMNVRLQKYHFDELQMDTDTEKILVVCNTFHGHALPSVCTDMVRLQQSPFVYLCL
ncbi:hypothetical protein GmHk_14G041922 [Glycine max]|nr:hypothetical protein GmHk_14G041922 [Glycine max]